MTPRSDCRPHPVALFDFDQTLVTVNSLGLLFQSVSGRRRLWPMLVPLLYQPASYASNPRSIIKRRLYRRCLGGQDPAVLVEAAQHCASRLRAVQPVLQALESLAGQGHQVWIATASPRPFVERIVRLRGWPVQRVIGTELPVRGGLLTGDIGTECAYRNKARLLLDELARCYASYEVTHAYGNLPVDMPMLELASRRFAVWRGRVKELRGRTA
ncbi:MAG: haloacid dehalogenase-like hydrolase [Gammaproteobacteria bacterium]|nr:haloacid dehalogenase-like hydrolase [Gammaproteobacteria bacterium]